MKRLALLAVTAFVAVTLSACGERAERRTETSTPNSVHQQETGTTNTGETGQQSGQ